MTQSFKIAVASGCFFVTGIFLLILDIFPFQWSMLLWTILITLFGFGLSWIVRKIERVERNWNK